MESPELPSQKRKNLIDMFFEKLRSLRTSDAFFFKIVLLSLVVFIALFVIQQSNDKTVEISTDGGVLSEGIIGTPRFVNPVLSVTRADKDLTSLIYDGLMKLGNDGFLIPNIAESVTISDDGLIYNVVLKENVKFHDESQLTAKDVIFTILRIQDPLLGSPLLANFDGVLVEEIGEYEINFVLPEAYAPFIENLTFGILPHHIWKDAGADEFPFSQHNTEAIGSGPYVVEKIVRNASGIPEKYTLKANNDYHSDTPKNESINLLFFPTEAKLIKAFLQGDIESVVGLSAEHVAELNISEESNQIKRIPLPRTFAVFINQNRVPALRDIAARNALEMVVDKQHLIDSVLDGYGNALSSPVPPGFGIELNQEAYSEIQSIDEARQLLRESGWKLNPETEIWEKEIDDIMTPLSFSISTVNSGTFESTAEFLRKVWTELGAEVSVKQFELSDLTQAVIRPRDYQMLLFGTQLGRSLDYYSFWHSSQKNDPGLNIALYANITTDSILTELRRSASLENKTETILKFANEIEKETPAIFLYAPELIYVFPTKIKNSSFSGVGEAHERFSSIKDWYIETESVWSIFNQ